MSSVPRPAPWPRPIMAAFRAARVTGENDMYGAWNKLLAQLFPISTEFIVHTHYGDEAGRKTADHDGMVFLISYSHYPVLVLQIKPEASLGTPSARVQADDQIRSRLLDLFPECPLPTLYGISAFGRRFHIIKKTGSSISPPYIPRDPTYTTDVVPASLWRDSAIRSAGADQLNALATLITTACHTFHTEQYNHRHITPANDPANKYDFESDEDEDEESDDDLRRDKAGERPAHDSRAEPP
ncbi:hypothetical protein FB451DRAFT_1030529 [Mycena latifolia]|nr:hypothetical protein FB451DRAFT_1030529 [Mycena latifolia]